MGLEMTSKITHKAKAKMKIQTHLIKNKLGRRNLKLKRRAPYRFEPQTFISLVHVDNWQLDRGQHSKQQIFWGKYL